MGAGSVFWKRVAGESSLFRLFLWRRRRHDPRRADRRRPATGRAKQALGSLGVEGWDVSADRVVKCGITATKFRVHEFAAAGIGDQGSGIGQGSGSGAHRHYHLSGIKKRIAQSALSDDGKARASALFDRLGGSGSRHPQHARGKGPPARSRRARLDRRHRRRRLRARLVQGRSHRRVAHQRRERNGQDRARPVSRAGAGDAAPPRQRASLLAARSRRSC